MPYTKQSWVDVSAGQTAPPGTPSLSADNLKHIEDGVASALGLAEAIAVSPTSLDGGSATTQPTQVFDGGTA